MLNCLKLQNTGGWHLSWRWWPLTILSTNLLEVMLLHWSKNLWREPAYNQMKVIVMKTVTHQEWHFPWLPFFWKSVVLVDTPPTAVPPLTSIRLRLKVRNLCKEVPPDSCTGQIWTLNWNPHFGLVLVPLIEVDDWKNPREDWGWACVRNQMIYP